MLCEFPASDDEETVDEEDENVSLVYNYTIFTSLI